MGYNNILYIIYIYQNYSDPTWGNTRLPGFAIHQDHITSLLPWATKIHQAQADQETQRFVQSFFTTQKARRNDPWNEGTS